MMVIILFVLTALLAGGTAYVTFAVLQHRESEALRFAVPKSDTAWKERLKRYFSRNKMALFITVAVGILLLFGFYLIALFVILGALLWVQQLHSKRRREIVEHLPAAVAIMVRSMRAGQTIDKAMKSVVDYTSSPVLGTFFQRIVQLVYISGRPVHEILFEQARREQINELNMLASILESHTQVGGNIIEVLTVFEEQMRRTMVTDKKIGSLMSEGRWGLVLVPLFYLIGVGFSIAFARGK